MDITAYNPNKPETRNAATILSTMSPRRGTRRRTPTAAKGGRIGLGTLVLVTILASISVFAEHGVQLPIVGFVIVVLSIWFAVRIRKHQQQKQKEERLRQEQEERARQQEERARQQEERARQVEEERARQQEERARQQEERARQVEEERRKKREELEEQRRRAEREREEQVEALLQRDAFRDSVNYMSGVEFEHFMADVFKKQGYVVQTTPASGDQGVDLLLTIEDRKVAVQLKRFSAKPVGNDAVMAVFAGMFYYTAKEAWIITTSSFTKKAVQLAKSNHVRLIDGRELEEWLSDLGADV